MSAASAAALMLTMGALGERRIESYTSLTYHFSRVSGSGTITASNAQQLKDRLDIEDQKILDRVVSHVVDTNAWQAWCDRMLSRIQASLTLLCQTSDDIRHVKSRLQKLEKQFSAAKDAKALEGRYRKWLVSLFMEDRPIDNLEAWCLNLVDEVTGLTPRGLPYESASLPQPAPRVSGAPLRMEVCQ